MKTRLAGKEKWRDIDFNPIGTSMNIIKKPVFLFLAVVAGLTLTSLAAHAHRFNLALVVPLTNTTAAEGQDVRKGFMLATTERDGHPDEESDGHLGGLDVYVSVVDGQGDIAAKMAQIANEGEIDIVVAFGSSKTRAAVTQALKGKGIAVLTPGESPFSRADTPAVARFIAAYEKANGAKPSPHAAQGYNAARRVDAAVRAQGGVDDKASLEQSFRNTSQGFAW